MVDVDQTMYVLAIFLAHPFCSQIFYSILLANFLAPLVLDYLISALSASNIVLAKVPVKEQNFNIFFSNYYLDNLLNKNYNEIDN